MIPPALRAMLTPRALAAWAGTDRLSALAFRLPEGPALTTPARLLALLVAGDALPADVCPPIDEALLEDAGHGLVRARWSVLPHGPSLLVCDRLDATTGARELVCWPDDSSYHLARSIPPGRRPRWLDVGCGSAFAPLLHPELANDVLAADLNPRAARAAKLGVALSGHTHIRVVEADLLAGLTGPFELVTCNAPIPAEVGPLWRATADRSLFARLLADVPRVLAPGGMFVLHAALDAVESLVTGLPGERVVISYVPEGGRPFGIVWWRPDAEPRLVSTYRELTTARPHLTHEDRSAALG